MVLTAHERDMLAEHQGPDGTEPARSGDRRTPSEGCFRTWTEATTARVLPASCRVLREVAEKGDRFTIEVADVLGSAGMTAAELAALELEL